MTDENTDPQTAGTEPTVPDWLLPNEPMTCSNGSR